jgi:hypothetical protein
MEKEGHPMTTHDLKSSIRIHKDAGHSKVPVQINVLEDLIRDAERWRNLERGKPSSSFGNVINGRF